MNNKAKKPFFKMKPAERRVEIAKDVISRIKAGTFVAHHGVYIKNEKLENDECSENAVCKTDIFLKDLGKCEVCARGALLLSRLIINPHTIRKIDLLGEIESYNEYGSSWDEEYDFNRFQLETIETAFEGRELGDLPWDHVEECIEFCKGVKSPEDRLLMIMQNIIDHNGTFVPSVKYEIV